MKKIFSLLLCLILVLSLAACGDSGDTGKNTGDENGGSSSVKFYVEYNGVKIELGEDASSLINSLGQPLSESEMGSCGDQGTITKYVYDSIELYLLKNGGKATVDHISLKNDLISTPEGVKIGSSADDVVKKLGNAHSKNDEKEIRYTSANKNIKFQLRDGSVTAIDYMMLG